MNQRPMRDINNDQAYNTLNNDNSRSTSVVLQDGKVGIRKAIKEGIEMLEARF
jgi:hypothetical protein